MCYYSNIHFFHYTVYCESCIVNPDEQMLTCKVCQSCHPSGFPKVCLELGRFLEEQFPKEYAMRRDAVQFKVKQADLKHENPAACMLTSGQFHYSDVSVYLGV